MTDNIKNKFASGIIWNSIDKLFIRFFQVIIGIILAHFLSPKEFGLFAMISILLTTSQVILESGLGSALIQKKIKKKEDYSTVFVFNLIISLLLYFALFYFAPIIADFYKKSELVSIIRLVSLTFVIQAFSLVQITINLIKMDFKKIAKVNVFAVFISGIIAILTAYYKFGVWSLVALSLSNVFVSTIMFWYFTSWKISFNFSIKSFKTLFNFGSKLLLGGIYSNIMREIYNVIVGKKFSVFQLGYFSKGKEFSELSSGVITSIIHQVSFPLLSSLQEDRERMIQIFSRLIRFASFLIFPSMIGFAILAEPFIKLLFNEDWYDTIPFLQLFCISYVFYPISALNLNLLNAIGRSDLFLKVDLSKLPLIIIFLIITVPLGLKAMVVGSLIIALISFFIDSFLIGHIFGYGAWNQIKEMLPYILNSFIMALIIYLTILPINNTFLQLFLGIFVGVFSYLIIAKILKFKEIDDLVEFISKIKKDRFAINKN